MAGLASAHRTAHAFMDPGDSPSRRRAPEGARARWRRRGLPRWWADLIRQGLAARVVDELAISTAPVVLGGGKRLFEGFEQDLDLDVLGTRSSQYASHVRYAVRPAGQEYAHTDGRTVVPRRHAERGPFSGHRVLAGPSSDDVARARP